MGPSKNCSQTTENMIIQREAAPSGTHGQKPYGAAGSTEENQISRSNRNGNQTEKLRWVHLKVVVARDEEHLAAEVRNHLAAPQIEVLTHTRTRISIRDGMLYRQLRTVVCSPCRRS